MTVEFLDTNILIYAEDSGMGVKHQSAVSLVARLAREDIGALSTQVLAEYYNAATRKLHMTSEEAEETERPFMLENPPALARGHCECDWVAASLPAFVVGCNYCEQRHRVRRRNPLV